MRMTTGIERLKTICGALHPGGIVRMPHERLRGIIEQIERETVPAPEWPDDSGLPEEMRVLAVLVWRDSGDHSEVHLTKQNYDWFCWLYEHGGPERIEKRLMPKGMEWPRYEDGELVVIGGAVASGPLPNIAITVEAIEFTDGCAHIKDGEDWDWGTSIEVRPGSRVKRPVARAADDDQVDPDSWEFIEEEAKSLIRDISMHLGDYSPSDFEIVGDSVQDRVADLVRRCKALAERGA